jgi:polyisoprenoid-binding protein YceI
LKRFGILVLIMILAVGAIAEAQTKKFFANDEKKRDVVTFTSKAPLETIVGTTGDIVGMVEVNPDAVDSTKARFEVNLASLKTGIEMRDGHMRNQYLETAKFPKAIFELTKIVKASQNKLEDQKSIDLIAEGNFTVHGVTRLVTIPLTITYLKETEDTKAKLAGDLLRVEGNWIVSLADYNISRPQFVFLKLDDKQKINIDVFTSTGSPVVDFADSTSK